VDSSNNGLSGVLVDFTVVPRAAPADFPCRPIRRPPTPRDT
jgi:hypothetical protein